MRSFIQALGFCGCVIVASCSPKAADKPPEAAISAAAVAPTPPPVAAPRHASTTPPAAAGFDPATTPLATPNLGAWPYFSLLDGYIAMTPENNPGDSSKQFLKDVAFDQYVVFDGTKLITLEGRLKTVRGDGANGSFFEVKKTYEKLIRDQGGVTVYEGSAKPMKAANLTFEDPRQRGNLVPEAGEMGVYMLRAADKQIWVEVYRPWNTSGNNYWLTIVEKKIMDMRAAVLPAEEMKRALDAEGRVALYVSFDTNKSDIKPESALLMAQIVKLLTDNPALSVNIDGHTDDVGTPASNLTLAQRRADAVVAELVVQGVAASRLKARSFGQTKPLAPNDNDDNRSKNRRVELVSQ